jgi:hypothetical protein
LHQFAQRINKKNILEGLTLAFTSIKSDTNDKETELFNCHINKANSVISPFNYLIIVGAIRYINGKWFRISIIGYGRKSIDDFYNRLPLFLPVINLITKYYNDLPASTKRYDHTTLTKEDDVKYLITDNLHVTANNAFVLRPANIEIKCYLSIYVYIVLKIKKQFGLTDEQVKLFHWKNYT